MPELIDAEFDECKPPNDGYVGVAYDRVIRRSDNRYGILVSFISVKEMTMSVCCHEASHACDGIKNAIGMDHGGEASVYLMGWIASCINKARLGIGDFIEIKDKEE